MRRMTSPKRGATERTVMLGSIFSGGIGMVLVVTISLMGRSRRRSVAGGEKVGWVKER